MAAEYPDAVPTIAADKVNATEQEDDHPAHHNQLAEEVVSIATELKGSGKGFVNHGVTAGTARPTGHASIEWVGSVEPTNAVDGDTWIDTA